MCGDEADLLSSLIDQLPVTTSEIRTCCDDLPVLGRADFKQLLKWRLQIRRSLQLDQDRSAADPAKETIIENPMDDQVRYDDMAELRDLPFTVRP